MVVVMVREQVMVEVLRDKLCAVKQPDMRLLDKLLCSTFLERSAEPSSGF